MTDRPDDVGVGHDDAEALTTKEAPSLAQRHALSAESAPALLALYAAIVEELHGRGVVRSTNNPVGDYAEHLTARAFGLSLAGNSSIGYDAVSEDGIRYQVKSRRLTPRNPSRQLSAIRGLEPGADPFDFLVGILFTADFVVLRAALVPVAVVRQLAVRNDYVNAWRLMLRDSVWAVPGVGDVTDRIREAAEAAPLPRPAPEGRHRSIGSGPESCIGRRSGRATALDAEGRPARGPGLLRLDRTQPARDRRDRRHWRRRDRDRPEPQRRPVERRALRAGACADRRVPGHARRTRPPVKVQELIAGSGRLLERATSRWAW